MSDSSVQCDVSLQMLQCDICFVWGFEGHMRRLYDIATTYVAGVFFYSSEPRFPALQLANASGTYADVDAFHCFGL